MHSYVLNELRMFFRSQIKKHWSPGLKWERSRFLLFIDDPCTKIMRAIFMYDYVLCLWTSFTQATI